MAAAGGEANSYAQALADEAREDPDRRDAIATALAEATDLSKEDANKYLTDGNVGNLADAIAKSSGGSASTTAVSLSEVRRTHALPGVHVLGMNLMID